MTTTIRHATTGAAVARLAMLLATTIIASCSTPDSARKESGGEVSRPKASWSPATLTEVHGVPVADVPSAIAERLAAPRPGSVEADSWQHTQRLYKRYGQTPLWLTSDGLAKDRAGALSSAVINISADGLRLDPYPVAELANALAALRSPKPTAAQLADADVLLTTTYASVGEDLVTGQIDPRAVGQAWHIVPQEENVDSALVRTLGQMPLDKGINAMRPQNEDYAALQKELVRYRDLVAKGDWANVPAGRTLKPGELDSPKRIAALRDRLAAEGYDVGTAPASQAPRDSTKPAPLANGVFDNALAEAVGRFQARHAITVDKNLGPETVNSLNVPAAYRLGQIAANLERQRWMPRSLGNRYVYVNVPAFQLEAFDGGEKKLEMKVIVGQEFEDKATPVFSDSMELVIFRPYWNITPDIQAKEVAPKIAADPGYMNRENLEYYKDGGVTRIRQKPGPKNALGSVKFLFPNDFNIYLHDTPNHALFEKDVRAFSHGCIRVEKPDELAQWVLGWDAERVRQAMQDGKDNTSVKLPKKIPVYITYGTAFVQDGQLHFGNDLYHRDDKLVHAASTGALPSPRALEALQALKRIAEG
jgi:murein L,D-transpeptidase YcbB/YkuD